MILNIMKKVIYFEIYNMRGRKLFRISVSKRPKACACPRRLLGRRSPCLPPSSPRVCVSLSRPITLNFPKFSQHMTKDSHSCLMSTFFVLDTHLRSLNASTRVILRTTLGGRYHFPSLFIDEELRHRNVKLLA